MTDCRLVTTALPSETLAREIARIAVAEQLAACVQVQGPVHSVYRWEGRVEEAEEWCCHCKTTAGRSEALIARIRSLHPYQVPEIVVLPLVAGHPPYLDWVRDAVRGA